MVKLTVFFTTLLVGCLMLPTGIYASDNNSYVTVISPVRSRQHWKSIDSVRDQIQLIQGLNIPATWLLQYSVLIDPAAVNIFKDLPGNQEVGIFLEVDENLATSALVPYKLGEGDWARADKVLLSGYTVQERKRMIDEIFARFKQVLGRYPASVGAWYIDAVSLNYMEKKYDIEAVLDVADQYQTDTYGVWGKPWGTPYYPSKINSLIPAQSDKDRLDLVKIQWAPRDPVKGYGLTVFDSTYSIQANDYKGHDLDTRYFKKLAEDYLFSDNPLSQITVGLEAGQEGVKFATEYKRQLELLKEWEEGGKLKFIDMRGFASLFKKRFKEYSPNFVINGNDIENPEALAYWYSTPFYRIGLLKKDKKLLVWDFRIYSRPFIFKDVIKKDEDSALKRIIPSLVSQAERGESIVLFSDIDHIAARQLNNALELNLLTRENKNHFLRFQSDKIFIDEKKWFHADKFDNRFDSIVKNTASKLVEFQVKESHKWQRSFRFSYINGVYYFGITASPIKFLGIRSQFPFFTVMEFPFQVLSHFKSFPDISPLYFLSNYFINYVNNSTIELDI